MAMYTVDELVGMYREVERGWNNKELTLMQVVARLTDIDTEAKFAGCHEEMMARLRKEDGKE